MDWKTDSNDNEPEAAEPYSSFQSSKSGKWIDRMDLPIILIGAGLLALVILFVLFIPKKNEFTADDYKHIVSRLDQLEAKLTDLSGKEMDISEFDPAKNPVQYQQVINWIKTNAEVISETIKKLDDLENTVKILQSPGASIVAQAPAQPAEVKKQTPPSNAVPPSKAAPPEPEAISIAKSHPVAVVKQEQTPKPAPAAKEVQPKADAVKIPEAESKPKVPLKPVVEKKSAVKPPPAEVPTKPALEKPETVKYVFHRVEKGETLYRISKNYGISVEKLQELNKKKKDDLLIQVGQELIVRAEKQ